MWAFIQIFRPSDTSGNVYFALRPIDLIAITISCDSKSMWSVDIIVIFHAQVRKARETVLLEHLI